jgi:hypothetical protein
MSNIEGKFEMKKQFYVHFIIIGFLISCTSTPDVAPIAGPYFNGDGGKYIRFAVLEPSGYNLSSDEQWVLTLVQGTLTNDFKKYSAMTVLDRQNLDKILENQAESLSGDYSDEGFISIGNLINAQYILIGSVTKTQQNILLVNLSISDASTGELKASYPPINCTFNELQGLSIIKKASEELLLQMGVSLTDAGKQSLYRISETSISAETALSKGVHAQRNGTIGEALSYYYNAISFEPSLAEAKGRLSVLSTDISSGNIGQSARNAISYRNAWKKILMECNDFLNDHILFEIVCDPTIRQKGKIDYDSEKVNLEFTLTVKPSNGFNMIRDIIKGLNKTGKRNEWGFTLWPFDGDSSFTRISLGGTPQSGIFQQVSLEGVETTSRTEYIMGNKLDVEIGLKNNQGQIISRVNTTLWGKAGKYTRWHQDYGAPYSPADIKPDNTEWNIVFIGVNANDITDLLTVEILSVNGIDAESATRNGFIKISSGKI